jgi:hypothetical protein
VSTVSLPFSSDTIDGKADTAVAGVGWASEEHANGWRERGRRLAPPCRL